MKGTPLKFNYAPKMTGRNSASRFAAYLQDGSTQVEAEEKAFLESIKTYSEEAQGIAKAARAAFSDKIQEIQAKMLAKEEAEPIIAAHLETVKDMPQVVAELKSILAKHGTSLSALKSGLDNPAAPATLKSQIAKTIEENAEAIKASVNGTPVKMELKVVGNITTGSSTSISTPQLIGVQVAPPSNAAIRQDGVMDLVSNFQTSLAAYPYTETLPKDGDFSFQSAEGVAKSQIDFKTETRYATPVTLAAWEGLSTQSVQDIPGLQSIATNLLLAKHDRKKNKSLLFGTGADGECKGATLYASAFTCPSALQNMVEKPTIMDCINAVATTVFCTHDYQDQLGYRTNLAMVHPYDFFLEFVSAKDGFGHPLYPTAAIFNQVTIGGMTIRPSEDITAGYIFAADMSKYNVSDYIGYSVTIGRINDDLIKNQFVILGESRFHAFVKKLDEKAFIYDTIANVRNAIAKAS